ncbi:hypothetical protein GCM10011403_09440 [Pseudohongiella nitratireducens]|uniref:Uncharacterized protein n=1 Tax=Pseudohongiella nitratireducens TaxID=1768907 RepID=A0A917GR09_9GAMM|nr:hypothetical protein [Pseudohongiella nitratireducens]MDF1623184.1 hypothetical protein [Pseudohongiella nitratireducens]GGG54400.1 hypothetical protein GCM10011403_09440 [Pseudohongiella nitratireducens]|tara:strand:+ start:6034 stop:6279 length:246 start_codon:yes stop_codon:yes gene_type:complete
MAKKRLLSHKLRATLTLVLIAGAALYALVMSYNISTEELLSFFLGTLLFLGIILLSAVAIVIVIRLLAAGLRRLRGSNDRD